MRYHSQLIFHSLDCDTVIFVHLLDAPLLRHLVALFTANFLKHFARPLFTRAVSRARRTKEIITGGRAAVTRIAVTWWKNGVYVRWGKQRARGEREREKRAGGEGEKSGGGVESLVERRDEKKGGKRTGWCSPVIIIAGFLLVACCGSEQQVAGLARWTNRSG